MGECIRVLGTYEGVSSGSKNCPITLTENQEADETIVVIALQGSFAKASSSMAAMNACSDSQGNTYHVGTSSSFNIGAIRANLGGGSDNDGMQLGTSAVMNDTSSPVLLVAGDVVTAAFGPGETPDGYCAVVLGVGLRAGNNPGVLPRSYDPLFPSLIQYGGLSTTQGNTTLEFGVELGDLPQVQIPGTGGIVEAFALCAAGSIAGEVVPAHPNAEEIVHLQWAPLLDLQVWAILHLADNEDFEPGASSFSGDANVANFQLGTTTSPPGSPAVCVQPAGEPLRFGESGPWRFVITDLDSETLGLLDRLAINREITFTLNAPLRATGSVPSDNPEINLETGDGDPILAEGNRLCYMFRRERDNPSSEGPVWQIRAAGIVLVVEDQGGPDAPITDFEVYDPWQLMYRRPVRDEEGNLPGEDGLLFNAAGSAIAEQLIAFSELVDGTTHLDLLTGIINTTDVVEIEFQQGLSLGEALDALCDTGTMDIVLEAVYDPINKPGITHTLNIYDRAGTTRYDSIFAWDKPSRNLVDLNRLIDGRERANYLQYYVGQGGPPVPLVNDAGSTGKYGRYWESQFFPGQTVAAAVEQFAEAQLRQRKNGLITYSLSPAPERAPVPLTDYHLGDFIPIHASSRLRAPVNALKRVYQIPLVIGDDQMEAPASVTVADDEVPEP